MLFQLGLQMHGSFCNTLKIDVCRRTSLSSRTRSRLAESRPEAED